jgi:NAD(P)-dependent dehydrogenase (short-subunit alcohol dehydrogenase family)
VKKTAIVTGGSRGIGFAIARRLGLDGFNVVIFATNPAENHAGRLALLAADGTEYLYVQGNLASGEDRLRLVAETVARFGGVQVLVNNAGVAPLVRSDLLDMTEESFDRVVGINTKGNMFLTQAVARQMLKQGLSGRKRGTIINISSCSAEVSSTGRGEYCVSKAGVSMLTTLYADRLAGEGILVHEIRPGVISTDMTSAVTEKYDALIANGAFPIARWGTPEDIAGAVSAFAGEDFLYTTGNYIDVDGGFHIKRL